MRRISLGTIRLLSISSARLASIIPPGRAWFQPILGASSPACASDNQNRMKLRVECYSGRKANERPVPFQLDERGYRGRGADQWYGQDATFFKVRADEGNLFILWHDVSNDEWGLKAFRELKKQSCLAFEFETDLQRSLGARSGLLGVAALEIFDHLFDGRDFILEPLFQFFQGFDPLFAGVEMAVAPRAAACEAREGFKALGEWVEIRAVHRCSPICGFSTYSNQHSIEFLGAGKRAKLRGCSFAAELLTKSSGG